VSIFEANTVNFSINIDYWQHKAFPASNEGEKLRAGRAKSCRFLESSNINSFQNVFLINENAEYLLYKVEWIAGKLGPPHWSGALFITDSYS